MHTAPRRIELEMIKRDVAFFCGLLSCFVHDRPEPILPFGLMPYLSLFVMETYSYFSAFSPDFARDVKRQHEGILRASRTRVKLFDDSQRNVTEILNYMGWISEYQVNWFVRSHTGYLARLKRAIQPDLGLYFYNGHLISTTHTAFFNLGFERKTTPTPNQQHPWSISDLSKSIGTEIGQYIGGVSQGLGMELSANAEDGALYSLSDNALTTKDVKSHKYYRTVFNGSSSVQLNQCLVLFLATVNFLNLVFRQLMANQAPDTFFKLKFIALYHLTSSLKKIQDYYYPQGLLSQRSKEYLAEILADKKLKLLTSNLRFRNALVHYQVKDIEVERLDVNVKLFGLTNYFFDGRDFEDMNRMVDKQVGRVSKLLTQWTQ